MISIAPSRLPIGVALTLALALPTAGAQASIATHAFTTTGEHAFVVPSAVTGLRVTLVGGIGATGTSTGATPAPGGRGATVSGSIAVTPGETLYAEVAGNGQVSSPAAGGGGYGGGGDGGPIVVLFAGAPGGGGGGGASDIRSCPTGGAGPSGCSSLNSRLIVAAGGGGGGGAGLDALPVIVGGSGGAAELAGGNGAHSVKDLGGDGGQPGTSAAGGAAGGNSSENPATAGQFAKGGSGGVSITGGGGGGGGGLFGGGGGGAGNATVDWNAQKFSGGGGGGGGGGTSGVPAGAVGVSEYALQPTAAGAGPAVTISWTEPAPTVATAAPTTVTASTAALAGSVDPNGYQITDCHFVISPAPVTGATVPCAQQVGAGTGALAVTAGAVGLAPDTSYTATLIAASAPGVATGQPVAFTTPATATTASTGAVPARPSALKLSPTRFRSGSHRARVAKHAPVGTTVAFQLSAASGIQLTFERVLAGRTVGRRCVAPAHAPRRGRRCTRYVTVAGSVLRPAHAGVNRIRFEGVLDSGHRLTPGAYRLSLVAAGSVAPAQRVRFAILSS